MNTSLSTARMRVSSARDTPMPLPISELFHGTMTSDFGASWLPKNRHARHRLRLRGSAGLRAPRRRRRAAPAALALRQRPLPRAQRQRARAFFSMAASLAAHAPFEVGDPDRDLRVIRHERVIRLVVPQRTAVIALIQVAEDREILVRHMEVRVQRERLLVAARARRRSAPACGRRARAPRARSDDRRSARRLARGSPRLLRDGPCARMRCRDRRADSRAPALARSRRSAPRRRARTSPCSR